MISNTDTQADPREDFTDDQLPFATVTNLATGLGMVIEGLERMMLPKLRELIFTEPMLAVTVICRCGINQAATYQESPDAVYALVTHAVHCIGGVS
jgi:hypothetical protein